MPKCANDTMDLPFQEICKMISESCKRLFDGPNFIKCEDTKLFPRLVCKNNVMGIKFYSSSQCLHHAPSTSDHPLAVFEGVEGCGIPCTDSLYTQDEQTQIHSFIFWAALICCCFNVFTIVSSSRRYSCRNFNVNVKCILYKYFIGNILGNVPN